MNTFGYVGGNPVSLNDPYGLFNPAKAASAIVNGFIGTTSAGSGFYKISIAAGISPASATGVGALPPTTLFIWGLWNLKSSYAAFERGATQMKEAFCEDWDDAKWQNFYGTLPKGTNFDDANDPYSSPWDYIQKEGWWEFIKDAGYF